MNQIDEFIYDEVPFSFSNSFIASFWEFYLNSYVEDIYELIFDEVPFNFSNPFIVGLQEFYLNSYVEEVYENMKVDLRTWQEYKQQIP